MMTQEEFVGVLTHVVCTSGAKITKEILQGQAGGRGPQPEDAMVAWYASLSEEDKRNVDRVALIGSWNAAFSFFCVLDGVRTIEYDQGKLTLLYQNDGQEVVLNDEDDEQLHDIFIDILPYAALFE